jgi:hypothetical protein
MRRSPDLEGKPIFDDWSQEVYAQFLSVFSGFPASQLNPRPGLVMSWLTNEREVFTAYDLAEIPYRGIH